MRLNQAAIKLAQKNAKRVEREALKAQRQVEREKRRAKQIDTLTFTLLFIIWVLIIVIMRISGS